MASTNELSGLGGYASLMRTQKNPFERDIAATQGIMNQMPQNGGVSGLEGLGKIPLMYQQGVDTANAQRFDEQRAIAEDKQIQGVMDYQQQKDAAAGKQQVFKNYIDLAKEQPEAANYYAMNDPIAKSVIPPGMTLKDKMDKNGWLHFETLNEDGTQKIQYQLNVQGLPQANDKLNKEGITNPTPEQITQAMPPGYAFRMTGAAKAAENKDPKLTGHLVKDPTSSTGYSYAGDDGEIMTKNAPTPSELHPRPAKEPKVVDPALSIKRVVLPGQANHTTFDISQPDMAQAYKTALLQGGKDVTGEVKTYTTTEGRALANNENPKPAKQGAVSALIGGGNNTTNGGNQPDLATAQKMIQKYGTPEAARAAWARGER